MTSSPISVKNIGQVLQEIKKKKRKQTSGLHHEDNIIFFLCKWHGLHVALLKCWFNSFCYQKNWAEFLKMSLLIKNYPAVGTERNPCSGAACTKLLHTHNSIAEDSPCNAGAVQHARGTSSQQQNWGLVTGITHSTPEQKPG